MLGRNAEQWVAVHPLGRTETRAELRKSAATHSRTHRVTDPLSGIGVYTARASVGLVPARATTGGYLVAHNDAIENPTRDPIRLV